MGAVAVDLPANKLSKLASTPGLLVTPDANVKVSGSTTYSNQLWPYETGNATMWYGDLNAYASKMPTIAIVDSGIDTTRPDFAGRIVASVNLSTLPGNSPGDGRGHGTFVAGVAAGAAAGYAGAAPAAKLLSIDVMDDNGMGKTSDIIAACQWILDHKDQYNIKVANFSLHSATPSKATVDPLDKAVEKLWFGGVTVVAAAGNYGKADGPSGVPYAPGNDPFVITVGAVDLEGSIYAWNHDVPNWSAYGYTKDGFRKPELAAAGRYMIGPVPTSGTLRAARPENVVSAGYMRLSGTSFSAPVVAGAAALLHMEHPTWTPDQIKGALMQRARYIPDAPSGSAGVGEINAYRSTLLSSPPNPNAALNKFRKLNPLTGTTEFDGSAWYAAAKSSVSWDSVSWSDVSWSDVSWSDVSWSDVSWSDVSWSDVSWSDVLAAADVSWEDNAEAEVGNPEGDYLTTPEDEALAAELGLAVAPPAAAPAP